MATEVAGELGIDLAREPLRVGLVVAPGALDQALRVAAEPPQGVVISGLELKTDQRWREQLAAGVELAQDAPYSVHVELSGDAVAEGGVKELAGTAARLKYRTGGLEATLFPSVAQLASVIDAAAQAEVPFKLTAGLHQAVRHTGPKTGFQHHGFLNIALATAAARSGADFDRVQRLLAERDHDAVRARPTPRPRRPGGRFRILRHLQYLRAHRVADRTRSARSRPVVHHVEVKHEHSSTR